MHLKKLLFISMFWIPGLVWNAPYSVPIGKCGNCLNLTVLNSGATEMEKIRVVVYSMPEWLSFSTLSQEIHGLSPNREQKVSFLFDVVTHEPGLVGSICLHVFDAHGQILGIKRVDLVTAVSEEKSSLCPSYPNPANPSMTIPFVLTKEAEVSLVIYNMLGQEIRVLFQGRKMPGHWAVDWDGKDKRGNPLPSGTYLVHLKIIDVSHPQTFTRKVLIQK